MELCLKLNNCSAGKAEENRCHDYCICKGDSFLHLRVLYNQQPPYCLLFLEAPNSTLITPLYLVGSEQRVRDGEGPWGCWASCGLEWKDTGLGGTGKAWWPPGLTPVFEAGTLLMAVNPKCPSRWGKVVVRPKRLGKQGNTLEKSPLVSASAPSPQSSLGVQKCLPALPCSAFKLRQWSSCHRRLQVFCFKVL